MSSLSLPHLRTTVLRVVLVMAVVAVTLAAVVLVGAEPAHGQAAPSFPCDGGLYVVTGAPTDMALHRVDQNTGSLSAIGGGGLTANALAYNPADDYLYGIFSTPPNVPMTSRNVVSWWRCHHVLPPRDIPAGYCRSHEGDDPQARRGTLAGAGRTRPGRLGQLPPQGQDRPRIEA